MIEVLWIDDECIKGEPFILNAALHGIQITACKTYVEGIKTLEKEPKRWCAVILDIREQNAGQGTEVEGYLRARKAIEAFQLNHRQFEPFIFVLSGEAEYIKSGSLVLREEYASKNVYSKTTEDYKLLFDDIKRISNVSPYYQVQKEFESVLDIFKNYFKADKYRLLSLIKIILYDNCVNGQMLFNEFRKILEDVIFPKMDELGFFPSDIKSLNDKSKYFTQKDQKNNPEYIKRAIHSLVAISQDGSHAEGASSNPLDLRVDKDVSEGRAPYLLRSCLYELLNIIVWMKDQK